MTEIHQSAFTIDHSNLNIVSKNLPYLPTRILIYNRNIQDTCLGGIVSNVIIMTSLRTPVYTVPQVTELLLNIFRCLKMKVFSVISVLKSWYQKTLRSHCTYPHKSYNHLILILLVEKCLICKFAILKTV